MRLGSALALLLLALGMATACSGEDDGGSPPGDLPDAASGDEVCPDACATFGSCVEGKRMQSFDPQACEAQCKKELAGSGYLQQHVARFFFERLASQEPDPECQLGVMGKYGFDYYDGTDLSHTPDMLALEKCAYALGTGCGADIPVELLRTQCFTVHYRFNDQIRSDVEGCFGIGTCYEVGKCIAALPFDWHDEQWLAGAS